MAKARKKKVKFIQLNEKDEGHKQNYWDLIQLLESTLLGQRYPNLLSDLYSELHNVPRTLVAIQGEAIVGGVIRGECFSGNVTVRYIGVSPELHGIGIGRTLMQKVEEFAQRTKAPCIKVETTSDISNFFSKMGYDITKRAGDSPDGYEYLMMEKPL